MFPASGAPVDLDSAYAVDAGIPFHVRANMVSSVDGAATEHGRSGGLSGDADKALFKVLRDHADAVLVGAGTVRIEGYRPPNPAPDRRARRRANGVADVPRLVIVSGRLDLDPAAPLFTDNEVRPLVLTTSTAPPDRRRALAHVADVVDAGDGTVDLADAVDIVAATGSRRLLCEGGPHLLGQLAATGRLDELCLTLSPLLVGGDAMRILAGAAPNGPRDLRLRHVLVDDDFLFLRYALA